MDDLTARTNKLKSLRFSKEQLEVLRHRGEGLTIPEISLLGLRSNSATHKLLTKVYGKLDLVDLTDAARLLEVQKYCRALDEMSPDDIAAICTANDAAEPDPPTRALAIVADEDRALEQRRTGIGLTVGRPQALTPRPPDPGPDPGIERERERRQRLLALAAVVVAFVQRHEKVAT